MAEKKTFFDVFTRYQPNDDKRALLLRAVDSRFRYKRDPAIQFEVELFFNSHEDAENLYEIEDECRALYGATSFKIIPHFPASEFNISRFDEIAYEAAQCGAITHGFLTGAEYFDDGETIRISIPFYGAGVSFVNSAGTQDILAGILRSRYGIIRRIEICECCAAAEANHARIDARHAELLVEAEREGIERDARERDEAKQRQ